MPQKCRVKHMCMGLLEQAPGDKRVCRGRCSLCRPLGRTAPEWAVRSLRKTPKVGEVAQWFTEWHPFLWVSPEQKSQHGFRMGNYSWMCRPLQEMENKHPAHDLPPCKGSAALLVSLIFHPSVSGRDPTAVISGLWFTLPAWAPALLQPQSDFCTPISSCCNWWVAGMMGGRWGTMSLYTQ